MTLEGEAATSQKLASVVQSLQPIIDNDNSDTQSPVSNTESSISLDQMSKKDRIKHIIRATLKHGWFNSRDIFELYLHYINDEVSLSTVSTNLSRLQKENILERRGTGANIEYRLQQNQIEKIPEITLFTQNS
ncbi:MAG: hypothetical protein ACFFC7_15470 [Candidatus Hermodarchaeota archaeon]